MIVLRGKKQRRKKLGIRGSKKMERYICTVCGYIYDPEEGDPENGIEPGTPFEKIPNDWVCPICGVGKDRFKKEK